MRSNASEYSTRADPLKLNTFAVDEWIETDANALEGESYALFAADVTAPSWLSTHAVEVKNGEP